MDLTIFHWIRVAAFIGIVIWVFRRKRHWKRVFAEDDTHLERMSSDGGTSAGTWPVMFLTGD